jgi:outer membrane cobalamin receptor
LRELTLTLDGYFNDVTDKIVAFPSTYVWKMANYGRVHITGLDATANATWQIARGTCLSMGANYTLNHALDVTDPNSQGYRVQLPYTPLHSGSARLLLTCPWINIGYSALFSSERYSMSEHIARYRIGGYAEHTLTFSHTFNVAHTSLIAQAEAINFTNAQYQVIQYYPMPGRQFRVTLRWKI